MICFHLVKSILIIVSCKKIINNNCVFEYIFMVFIQNEKINTNMCYRRIKMETISKRFFLQTKEDE